MVSLTFRYYYREAAEDGQGLAALYFADIDYGELAGGLLRRAEAPAAEALDVAEGPVRVRVLNCRGEVRGRRLRIEQGEDVGRVDLVGYIGAIRSAGVHVLYRLAEARIEAGAARAAEAQAVAREKAREADEKRRREHGPKPSRELAERVEPQRREVYERQPEEIHAVDVRRNQRRAGR